MFSIKYGLLIRSQRGVIVQKYHNLLRFCSQCPWKDGTAVSNLWCWPICCCFLPDPRVFWGITWTLIPPDPSALRNSRGNLEWGSQASRGWEIEAEQPGETCSLTCSSASNAGFNVPVTQKGPLKPSSCDEVSTDGYMWAHRLKLFRAKWRGAGVQSWLYWRLSVCSINFFSPVFCWITFCGIQNRQEYLKGLEDPFGKWPALARSPRECIGFTFYRELEWDNPESTTCLLVFIYKPLQKSSIRSDACFGQMLSESTHTSSQA